MQAFFWVGLGGALGAMARYGVARLVAPVVGHQAYAIMAVNILGAALLGALLLGGLVMRDDNSPARWFLATGVLGGFTTFSTFALDAIDLQDQRGMMTSLTYVTVSVVGAILAAVLAGALVRRVLA